MVVATVLPKNGLMDNPTVAATCIETPYVFTVSSWLLLGMIGCLYGDYMMVVAACVWRCC